MEGTTADGSWPEEGDLVRNPYLLLGIDYGSPLGEAKRAFARAARELKRGAARKSFERADLSWALNEIEHAIGDPEAHVGYVRVPANPELYKWSGSGFLSSDPYLPGRATAAPAAPPSREMVEVAPVVDVMGAPLLQALASEIGPDPYPQLRETK